ncbi:MAG TPA: hypothetical protein VD789_11160 [Thermomicrobiales bacterium]|nr:hypothetical protein [Thermomicrobiales bacterium]
MRRHTLLAIMIVLLLAPSAMLAQTTEPVGTVSTGDDEVARAYDNPNAYFEVTIGVMVLGTIYDNPDQASRSAANIAGIFSAALTSDPGEDFVFADMEALESPGLGDESFAHRIPFTMFGSFEGEYVILTIRQDAWVQVMVGFGIGEVDVLADLLAIAEPLLPRWPSDDPIVLREDGLRTGGIWNMTPMPEDMAEGYVLDESFEEGPGVTASDVVPVATPGAGATQPAATPEPREPRVATPEPAETPEPTATEESTVEPTVVPATPEPVVTEPAATPEPAETPEPTVTPDPTEPAATPTSEPTEAPEPTVAETPEPTATEGTRDLPLIPIGTATPAATATVPAATPTPEPTATATTQPTVTATTEPAGEQGTPVPGGEDIEIATPDAINPRIALPFDVRIEVIFPLDRATVADDGSCSGSGLLDGLAGGVDLTLRTGGDNSLVATAPVSGPGIIAYDTVDRQEVCYFTASFTDVPPRAQYTLLAGESVLGRLTFEDLYTGEPVLIVIGGE